MTGDYCLYRHASPSGKVYIGVTKHKPAVRWRNGKGYIGSKYFYKAICKYGWDNFQHEILVEGLSYDDAMNMEIDLIAIHNSTNRECGYNLDHGGNMPGTHSEETKRKISIASTGRKKSPETLRKISISNMGKRKGKKAGPETKRKLSIAHMGKKASPEACAAISKALTGLKKPMTDKWRRHLKNCSEKQCRAVEQLDLNGRVIARFCSASAAAQSVNACSSSIGKVCRGVNKTCNGSKWRYV